MSVNAFSLAYPLVRPFLTGCLRDSSWMAPILTPDANSLHRQKGTAHNLMSSLPIAFILSYYWWYILGLFFPANLLHVEWILLVKKFMRTIFRMPLCRDQTGPGGMILVTPCPGLGLAWKQRPCVFCPITRVGHFYFWARWTFCLIWEICVAFSFSPRRNLHQTNQTLSFSSRSLSLSVSSLSYRLFPINSFPASLQLPTLSIRSVEFLPSS